MRKHLTYANVAATLALAGVIGGGGAYASGLIGSNDIKNNSVRSVDLKNRKAVKAKDVRRDGLTGKEIDERSLDAAGFARLESAQGTCDPVATDTFIDCASVSIKLAAPGRVLVIATGDFFSETSPASLTCRIAVDELLIGSGASPGEAATDNTSLAATDGFAATRVTGRLPRGKHEFALRCSQPTAGDGRLASASIAVLGISG